MASYMYDSRLTVAENRKRAIALHEREGPMVPVIIGDEKRGDSYISHWLFPDGAVLENDRMGLSTPVPPTEPPAGWNTPGGKTSGYDYEADRLYREALRNKVLYWRLRLQQVERTFDEEKAAIMKSSAQRSDIGRLQVLIADAMLCKANLAMAERDLNPPQYVPPSRSLTTEERIEQQRVILEQQELRAELEALSM